ncbi:MAG: lysophospholipid acyltransferase family protein [Bacteroidales bacterium]|nr:lysophospholipid acyltransferase family protein [Bacteroidales bacterium]
MNLAATFFFYLFVLLIGIMPFRLLYVLSDFVSFLLRKVFKYRKNVVINNLRSSFPEISEEETRLIVKRTYLNLSDVFMEGIRAFTMTRKQIRERHHILNPEILEPYFEAGQGIIVVTGHYGNWEWGALSPALQTHFHNIAFYKPLKNKWMDKMVNRNRSRWGTTLAPIRQTTKTFETYRGQTILYLMAADQSPSNREMAYWVSFLGRETAFLHGPEKHARNNNYPVIFVAIRRVKRGFYELELTSLVEDPSKLPDGEITRLFAEKLETLIREDPANWLWSHRRWKLTR